MQPDYEPRQSPGKPGSGLPTGFAQHHLITMLKAVVQNRPAESRTGEMMSHRLRVLALAAMVSTALPAQSAEPDRVLLRYELYGSGIHALTSSMDLELRPDRYAVELTANTRGTIGFLFPWTSIVRSDGAAAAQSLRPRLHEMTSNWRGEQRSVFLEYDGAGGFAARRVVPQAKDEDREPVADVLAAGTVDLLTAVVEIMRRIGAGQSCNQTVSVFDGRRRYNLLSNDRGWEQIKGSSYSAYSGQALACALRVQPVAGFWRKRQRRWAGAEGSEGQTSVATLWFAPVGQSPVPVPVRLKIDSPFGDFVGHLAAFERLGGRR
jgi:hypothetical protein